MINVLTNELFGPLSAPNKMLKLPNMPQTRMQITLPSSWYLETGFYALEREHIFMQEWHELQKKGTFHDNSIGLITDIENKNKRLKDKVEKMRGELAEAKIAAE